MASGRSLLERIRKPPPSGADRSTRDQTEDLVDSIRGHLEKMLNSRHGQALTVADYGIPALSEIAPAYPDSLGELEAAIRRSLEQYETRLRSVRVKAEQIEGTPFELRFHIRAQLAPTRDHPAVWFETTFDTSGVAHVSE